MYTKKYYLHTKKTGLTLVIDDLSLFVCIAKH